MKLDIISFRSMATVFVALIFVFAGCAQDEDAGTDESLNADTTMTDTTAVGGDTVRENIYVILSDDERFSTFVAAVDSADLDQTLSGPGPFTVFAPTNQALSNMGAVTDELMRAENEDELRDLLLNHISNGEMMAAELGGQTLRTLAGGDIRVTGSGDSLSVNDVPVAETNIDASNGVIHAVSQVLSPSMDGASL